MHLVICVILSRIPKFHNATKYLLAGGEKKKKTDFKTRVAKLGIS